MVFNETFASLTPNKPDYVILWHKDVSGWLSGEAEGYNHDSSNCQVLANSFPPTLAKAK